MKSDDPDYNYDDEMMTTVKTVCGAAVRQIREFIVIEILFFCSLYSILVFAGVKAVFSSQRSIFFCQRNACSNNFSFYLI